YLFELAVSRGLASQAERLNLGCLALALREASGGDHGVATDHYRRVGPGGQLLAPQNLAVLGVQRPERPVIGRRERDVAVRGELRLDAAEVTWLHCQRQLHLRRVLRSDFADVAGADVHPDRAL